MGQETSQTILKNKNKTTKKTKTYYFCISYMGKLNYYSHFSGFVDIIE